MNTRQSHAITRRAAVTGLGTRTLALAASWLAVSAQEATPTSMATHPIVGTWYFDFDPEHPGTLFVYTIYDADGTWTDVHPFAGTGIGMGQATGERTGEAINKYQNIAGKPGDFVPGTVTVWESLTVDASGDSHTWEDVVELRAIDGTVVARFPFTGEPAHRLTVEPPPVVETPAAATPAS